MAAAVRVATRTSVATLAPRSPSMSTRFGWCSPIQIDGEIIGGVYLESDLAGLHERRQRLLSIISLVLFGALAVAFMLSAKLQRLISGPILRLTAVTQVVSRDKNYDIRVEQPAATRSEC